MDTISAESLQNINIIRHLIPEDSNFPNNGLLPLIVYQKALQLPGEGADKFVKELFETNDWTNSWVNGIYDYHHYHSVTHEVLGIISGSARVQFGGPNGTGVLLERGDAVVIPAGVAHKAIEIFEDFKCVGAYPGGKEPDIKKGGAAEKEKTVSIIKNVELPIADPIYGTDGPLLKNWTS